MSDNFEGQRQELVKKHIRPQKVSQKVSAAFLKIPRHEFVPGEYQNQAYEDHALPIGYGQTISQPSLMALMTDYLKLKRDSTVLEIGTGSGYQAAILSHLAKQVFTVEIIPELAQSAKQKLLKLGIDNVHVAIANGTLGLPEHAPYDALIVTAGGKNIPHTLVDQLKEGGRIVMPVGETLANQQLVCGVKKQGQLKTCAIENVAFVPLIGQLGWEKN